MGSEMCIRDSSIVLPTLNGVETLAVTLPAMLTIERDDVEWVVSNNHSDDNLGELISSLGDQRLRLVEPPERLPIGKHLEFAYQQARGEWQGHLGDDDLLFPSRFAVLDDVIASTKALLIRGENVRYHWPDFPDQDLANTLDGRRFDGRIDVERGSAFAARMLNEVIIHGGGSWIIHRSVIEKVRARCACFSSPQHVEFHAMRAGAALAPTVATILLPIYVLGRHAKSAAFQALGPKDKNIRSDWSWSFEDPDPWQYCPFQYKGYVSISLDAALMVQAKLPEVLGHDQINWDTWTIAARSDIEELIRNKQLPPDARGVWESGIRHLPSSVRGRVWLREHPRLLHIARRMYGLAHRPRTGQSASCSTAKATDCFGWPHRLRGDKVGIQGIVDVPRWVETTFHGFFPER